MATATKESINTHVFLDIDGTLLNADYTSTDDSLPDYIQYLQQQANFTFAINSNRSLQDILPIAEQFNITGPLIAENGLFAYLPGADKTEYFLPASELKLLKVQKQELKDLLRRILIEQLCGISLVWRDTDTVRERSRSFIANEHNEHNVEVLNNCYREYTTSAHLLQANGDLLKPLQIQQVEGIIRSLTATLKGKNIALEFDPIFSILLLYSTRVSKQSAAVKLLRKMPAQRIYSIGDSMNDYLMTKNNGTFYAVTNAAKQVKEKAQVVSSHPHTKGVKELLEYINKRRTI